ncbi:MAG TPA: hypothetical protein VFG83_16660 [Kofleriaceae bacterium]|nr:hypothetical protein [Kofleriaceae bacterium]
MARRPRIIALHDYTFSDELFARGSVRERAGRVSARTGRRGKSRFTIEIESKPLLHDFDDLALGQGPADAIRDVITHKLKTITAKVAPATRTFRDRAVAAYKAGEPWAVKRFSGGRTGETPPKAGAERMFNFSGRLANNVTARENKRDNAWTINVPANRLNPANFEGQGAFERMIDQLHRYVPELTEPRKLLSDPEVRKAIVDSIEQLIINERTKLDLKRKQLRRQIFGLLGHAAGGVVRAVLG